MATEVSIRRTGYEVTEGTITEWLKKEGEKVNKGQPLARVETEKATTEIESPSSGVLRKIVVPEGKKVSVGEVIGIVAQPDEDISGLLKKIAGERETAAPEEKMPAEKKEETELVSKEEEIIPLRGVKKQMAEHMLQSKTVSAHATTFNEADVGKMLEFLEKRGKQISFTSLLIKASVDALKKFPLLNSSLSEDKIIVKKYYHIGVAMNIEDGLVVPVIKDADRKDLTEITKEIRQLTSRSREGSLSLQQIKGGTFTISNPGMYGSLFFTPIINQPQSAILGVGRITQRPVVAENQLAIKPMVYLCLSYNHRIVEGTLAQKFLQDVRQSIERTGVRS